MNNKNKDKQQENRGIYKVFGGIFKGSKDVIEGIKEMGGEFVEKGGELVEKGGELLKVFIDCNSNNNSSINEKEQSSPVFIEKEKEQNFIEAEPIKTIVKQSLILVFFAKNISHINYLKNIQNNKIDQNDSKKFYEFTQYLSQINSDEIQDYWNNLKQYEVKENEESDTDIYLVKIDLTETDPRFEANINQIDRISAFRNLPNLISKREISKRLKMSAGVNFKVYSR
jgi:hypothetical protein